MTVKKVLFKDMRKSKLYPTYCILHDKIYRKELCKGDDGYVPYAVEIVSNEVVNIDNDYVIPITNQEFKNNLKIVIKNMKEKSK